MTRYLVAHPTLQHSHQLAWALHEQGRLWRFWSGTPVISADSELKWLPYRYRSKAKYAPIPQNLRHHPLLMQPLLKLARYVASSERAADEYVHRVFYLFDRWVASKLHANCCSTVVAYENSALMTFRRAKKLGMRCVLDAPSFHHSVGQRILGERGKFREDINRRKDEEVALADIVLTCSPLAKSSYVAAGVEEAKVHSLLLGADLPDLTAERNRDQVHQLSFVFAGVPSLRKSTDLLLDVFGRLKDEGFNFDLKFIGGGTTGEWARKLRPVEFVTHLPNQPQVKLYQLLRDADCLLLPSRFDAFGMVVAEALACGTPAVVSTMTGAKALIDANPGAGWVVEPDFDSLYSTLRELMTRPELLAKARVTAAAASKCVTWVDYRARISGLLT